MISIPGLGGGLAVGFAAKKLLEVGDAYINLDAQLTDLTGSADTAADAQQQLFEMSQRTGTALLANSGAFAKMQIAAERTGLSVDQNITVLEGLNKIFALSGASATDTSIAMQQLGQALASGVLQGDEFRSISEAAPGLLRALAKELGVATGDLKKMGSEGKLTSEVLGKAFLNIAESGDLAFKEVPKTSARAFQRIINSAQRLWDHILDNTGLIEIISDKFDQVAAWIEANSHRFVQWAVDLKAWVDENFPIVQGKVISVFEQMKAAAEAWWPVVKDVFTRTIAIIQQVIPWVEKIISLIQSAASLREKLGGNIPGDIVNEQLEKNRAKRDASGPGGGTIVNNINQKLSRSDLATLNTNQARQLARS
jgi:tape measure domain-containing protein